MKNDAIQPRVRFPRIILILAAGLASGLLATHSFADDHWHHGDRGRHGFVRTVPRGTFVPRGIAIDARGYYSPYLAGRVYYAPQHHYHVTYRFPVFVDGAVVYRPYDYCGDRLFVAGSFALPRLAFGVTFARPGFVGGVWSPAPYGAPGPYIAEEYDSRPHCRHDDDDGY